MTQPRDTPFGILIAANNEEGYIGPCLDALLAQDAGAGRLTVVVAANACTDRTEEIVEGYIPRFAARDWDLICLHLGRTGKLGALAAGEAPLDGLARAYLDADVICDPALIGQVRAALAPAAPLYATGTLAVAPARSAVTRAYAAFWQSLPFVQGGAVGAGFFAMNPAGRALWEDWPQIISDDTFARLQFRPEQRIEVPARYHWPMIEGWAGLVRVRRRQDAGVREIRALYPGLAAHDDTPPPGLAGIARRALRHPAGFAVYVSVALAVRARRADTGWTRGR